MDEELGVTETLDKWSLDAQLLDEEVARLECVADNFANRLLSFVHDLEADEVEL